MTVIKAGILHRVVARVIDFVPVLAAAEVIPKAGWLAGLLYIAISDGLFRGQSLGKRLIGLKVQSSGGAPCTIKESILRNSTLCIGLALWKVPYLGWLLLAVILAIEFVVLLGNDDGRRIGDEIAKTNVVETEEATVET